MKLGLVTPLPPLPTGISEYAAELIPELAERCELHLVVEHPDQIDPQYHREYPVHAATELPGLLSNSKLDLAVYQMGNSLFHSFQLPLLRQCPGVMVLHDLVLHHLLGARTVDAGDLDAYRKLLVEEYGPEASGWPERITGGRWQGHDRYRLYCRLPLSRTLAESSLGVIGHSRHVCERLHRWSPDLPVQLIPHGAEIPKVDRTVTRENLGLRRDDFVIGILGGMAENRMYDLALEACSEFADSCADARLVIAGSASPEWEERLDGLGLGDRTTFTGRPDYRRFIENLASLDVGIALRYPTAGETSGTGIRLMSVGTPFITTDVDAFRELPEEAGRKVLPDRRMIPQIVDTLRTWHADPESSKRAGAAGLRQVKKNHSLGDCAEALINFCREVVELRQRRPAAGAPAGPAEPLVEAVVVSYNSREFISGCLDSLLAQDYPRLKITVVDNASPDGSADVIRERYPQVNLIASAENLGFAAGNNLVFERSDADYFALLNQDAKAEPDWVREMVLVADTDPGIAAVGAKMLMQRCPTIINSTGIVVNEGGWAWDREIGERDERPAGAPEEVFGACGGAMLLRGASLRQLGGFDSAYFMYFEDVDLCWRFRMAGLRVLYAPRAVVTHDYHGDRGTPGRTLRRRYMCERNRLQNLLKNGELKTLRKVLPRVIRFDRSRLKYIKAAIKQGRDVDTLRAIGKIIRRAWLWNLWHLPGILWRRRKVQRYRQVSDRTLRAFIADGVRDGNHVGDLERIHDRHSAQPVTAIRMGETDDECLGPGWHPAEGTVARQHRWTKARAWFYLRREGDARRLIMLAACPPRTSHARVWGDGRQIGECEITGDFQEYGFDLPGDLAPNGTGEYLLDVETFRPSACGLGPDDRDLGIVVSELRLE